MADLVEFLRGRLDEDERVARQGDLGKHPYALYADSDDLASAQEIEDWDQSWHSSDCGWRVGEGLDNECKCGVPARVLAEVAAKRAIMEEHCPYLVTIPPVGPYCERCGDAPAVLYPCDTVRFLVQPYADHPDFDPEWKTA